MIPLPNCASSIVSIMTIIFVCKIRKKLLHSSKPILLLFDSLNDQPNCERENRLKCRDAIHHSVIHGPFQIK